MLRSGAPDVFGLGVGLVLVAAGVILLWGVRGVDTLGWMLLVIGAVGVLISIVFWSPTGRVGREADRR
jgi:hypothetical protein